MFYVIWNICVQVCSNLYLYIKNYQNIKFDFYSEKISLVVLYFYYWFVFIVLCCFILDMIDFFFFYENKISYIF